MSVTSSRRIVLGFSGDITANLNTAAADHATSPGEVITLTLASGANTITAPIISGIVVSSLTITPPSANTNLMTLKGVSGDTGVPLHLTDPTSIGLDTTFVSLVINAAAEIVGVRLVWS